MVSIRWTKQAVDDLKSIAEYIRKDSKKYAIIQINRIRSRTQILKKFPNSGRIVPEVNNPKVRELINGNYRIIYEVRSSKRIDILTVHHSARMIKPERIK